jgi:hypothetical protein
MFYRFQTHLLLKHSQQNNASLTLNPAKSFIPKEKRPVTNPLFNKTAVSNPLALKTSKSAQSRDDTADNSNRGRNQRHKSDTLTNPNRSFTSGGQYYSPFNTITFTCLTTNIDTSLYCTKKQQVVIPVYQPFVKVDRKFTSKLENQLLEVQKLLRSAAEEGNLMLESSDLLNMIDNNHQLIKKCENNGIIHTTHRQFGNKKQVFHSLNLDLISHESILWCLRSLKRDEMTPTEKAIQSRLKEAFCYKVTNWLWDHVIESIKKCSSNFTKTHTYTISNPQSSSTSKKPVLKKTMNLPTKEDSDISELLIESPQENKASRNKSGIRVGGSERWSHSSKKYITTRNGKKLYYQFSDIAKEDIKFELEEDYTTTDSNMSSNNLTTYIIYPAGEAWVGVDQTTTDIDQDTYSIFLDFLKEYFTEDLNNFWDKYDSIINNEGIEHDEKVKKAKKHRNSTEAATPKASGLINYPQDEVSRAIPGGRYGCAQFAKT